jgi:hypothetical protein
VFIFTDEASEYGDQRDATGSNSRSTRRHHDWSAQVDSEQKQETGYSTDSVIYTDTVPRGTGARRGGRRGWQRGYPPLPNHQGVLAICPLPLAY